MKENKLEILEEASRYIALGFSVIPLGSITKDEFGKKVIEYPKDGWKKYQENIVSQEEVSQWDCENLGIVTGKVSNLLVLDTDSYKQNYNIELFKSFNLPITPVQETASGGRQYFFRLPKDLIIKNAVCIGSKDSGIDIRGDGGMVIVSPSTTPYGQYKWILSPIDTPLADIPPKLLKLLNGDSGSELKVRKTLPEIVGLKEGEGRNNAIASFIGKLLVTTNIDNWDREVWPMVQEVNLTYKPPLQNDELLSTYKSITKIESARRLKLNIKNDKKIAVETLKYISAMSHAELITQIFPLARYTLEPFFEQGTVNMISAPPNGWKSWLLFLFAGHIVNGTLVFDKFATEKANVMIVNEEDSARLIQDRLKLLNIIDISLPIYYRIAQGSKLTNSFVNSLINEAKEKNIGVIMFDSLRAIHDSEENSSTEMQKVLDLLKMIARENITVIFTHHHRKKSPFGKNDDAESSRGTSAINASISGHISLEEIEKEEKKYLIVKHLKSKVGGKLPPFDIEIVTGKSVNFLYSGEHQPKEQALTEAKTGILSELQNREELLGRKDFVYLKIGGTTTIKEATKSLEKEGKIKITLRRDAESASLKIFNGSGKPNEKLYSIKKDDDWGVFDILESEDT